MPGKTDIQILQIDHIVYIGQIVDIGRDRPDWPNSSDRPDRPDT